MIIEKHGVYRIGIARGNITYILSKERVIIQNKEKNLVMFGGIELTRFKESANGGGKPGNQVGCNPVRQEFPSYIVITTVSLNLILINIIVIKRNKIILLKIDMNEIYC